MLLPLLYDKIKFFGYYMGAYNTGTIWGINTMATAPAKKWEKLFSEF